MVEYTFSSFERFFVRTADVIALHLSSTFGKYYCAKNITGE